MTTEIGKIAHMLQETETPPTPLQKSLKKLSTAIGIGVVVIAAIIFGLEVKQGDPLADSLISALALAVAAVPEGLPAVITISLALGVQRMLRRNALVRKLPSVETLGSCTAICSDKTGTLTKGEMTVKRLFVDNTTILVSGTGYDPTGTFDKKAKDLELLLTTGALCNNAWLEHDDTWQIKGDPTEGALVVSAAKYGLQKESLIQTHKRVEEIPFTSERKMMSVVCQQNKQRIMFSKGAPEKILDACSFIFIDGKKRKITDAEKRAVLKTYESFGAEALRVLAFAFKEVKNKDDKETNLVFIGLQGMIDPPREEVKVAIETCKTAGIKTIMITGDYEITAKAIAKELGIPGTTVTGSQMDSLDLDAEIENIGVFARVDPKHKLKIVEALQKKGHIVAMTGDGVNDAPALKKADIGIAMGITGTDVAKESSQIVLTDDNFASIVNAVEEGRTIFANIRKFVEYLFSSNTAEVLVIFLALLMGLPLPLLAIQILWINLLTDGFPALALGFNRAEKNIMQQKPRKKNNIITPWRWTYIIARGILLTIVTLALYEIYLAQSLLYAQTVVFTTLVMLQLLNAFALRSETRSVFGMSPFSNKWLIGAFGISIALQLTALYSPLAIYFRTVPLTLQDWGYIISAAVIILVFTEIVKFGRYIVTKIHHNE
jgi:Ca2+-transporting ATPase